MQNYILPGFLCIISLMFPATPSLAADAFAAGNVATREIETDTNTALSYSTAKTLALHKNRDKSPEEVVESLDAKTSNWQEPSEFSEERYVLAIRNWLDDMDPQQRKIAYKILHEAHTDMRSLRIAIREKKKELATMSFNRHTTPEALPRLGQELQVLRKTLRNKLEKISMRLTQEAGVSMGPLDGDAFWLLPQDIESAKPNASRQKEIKHSGLDKTYSPMFSMH